MSTVQEIEAAITRLEPRKIHAVADWLQEYREGLWDKQIAADAKAGKLDSLIKKSKAGYRAGKATPFPRNRPRCRSFGRASSTILPGDSANARELLAAGHVEDALGADGAFEQHAGGALVGHSPNPACACATRVGAHDLQRALRFPLRHEGGEPALAGDLQRIEAEDLTCGADVFANRDELLLDVDGKVGGFGAFVEHAGQPAAGEVAQAVDFHARAQELQDGLGERGGVAFDCALEGQPFADGRDRHAVPAHVAVDQDGVARLHALGRDLKRVLQDADSGGIDEEAVTFALIHYLGVAGDDLHTRVLRGLLHRGDDLPQG